MMTQSTNWFNGRLAMFFGFFFSDCINSKIWDNRDYVCICIMKCKRRAGSVVKALSSHQCGPSLSPCFFYQAGYLRLLWF